MNKEDIKVNLIYFWETNKNTVYDVLQVITAPIWIPLFIICIPFMAYDVGDPEEDERWCKLHGYAYPYGLGWGCHKQVKKWQKEYKERHKIEFKKKIRERIKNHKLE